LGDTYHISIGQGDLQVTPVAMAVYASILANSGVFYPPHLATAILGENGEVLEEFSFSQNKVDIKKEVFDVVREGMRDAVKYGTAVGLSGYGIEIAAKTGTAEVGDTGRVHSWSIGFLPYDKPKIAWAILMENGPIKNTIGATFVASEMIQWIIENKFLQNL
jgi:penicillin-binding protein 2